MLIALLSTLAACGGSPASPDPTRIDVKRPEAAIVEQCPPVRWLPDHALTQAEVEVKWREDRRNLIDCGKRHATLANYTRGLLAEISLSD